MDSTLLGYNHQVTHPLCPNKKKFTHTHTNKFLKKSLIQPEIVTKKKSPIPPQNEGFGVQSGFTSPLLSVCLLCSGTYKYNVPGTIR